MNAGMRDLSSVVNQVHRKPKKMLGNVDIALIPKDLRIAAGDAEERKTFFDFAEIPTSKNHLGNIVYLHLMKSAKCPDYRNEMNKRINRTYITIPLKVRENILEAFGVTSDDECTLTTAIVALAEYAASVLKRDNKMLVVNSAVDPQKVERALVKRAIREANFK